MSPKHRMVTALWCCGTMLVTMVLSHGHLIMKEIMAHWPVTDSWEGRLENALYTQGGLTLGASAVMAIAIAVRGYLVQVRDAEAGRKENAQRERHERATASRHEAMMDRLLSIASSNSAGEDSLPRDRPLKKQSASGAKPR